MNVILPSDKIPYPGMKVREDKPYPTLYLLHGVFGNYTDWVCNTAIQALAEEKDLAVVMPSGDNMFYVDQPAGNNYYGEFVGQELVELTRKMFPLSHKREDTFIAGLSMGGYGALRNGLKYHETFGYIAALSAAMILDGIEERTDEAPFLLEKRSFAESIFGDLSKVREGDMDPRWTAAALQREGAELPQIYMACGTSDGLLEANRSLKAVLESCGAHVTYEEGKGGHEWDFWRSHIRRVLDWLPLDDSKVGITSGNIGI